MGTEAQAVKGEPGQQGKSYGGSILHPSAGIGEKWLNAYLSVRVCSYMYVTLL